MLLPWVRTSLLRDPKRLGRWGQRQAERYLKRRGLVLIARNFSCAGGELDLVMADREGTMVFVEVKSRQSESFVPALAAVNQQKREHILRTAKRFLSQFRISEKPLRFDVVTVLLEQAGPAVIKHYPNAFR
ncbi:MAG: YraN family protein [Planctomycetaceae bacterium]|nr:YraN family protein [Planctomycetaceae bacterium]